MLPSLPQRNARRHETNRSFLLALKGYQDGVNHNAGYAQRRAVPAWVNIAAAKCHEPRVNRRPSMEKIGSRATIFELEGLGREKRKFFPASLAEVPQGVQCAALHQRAQLLDSLVRQDIGVDDDSNDLACPFGDAGVGDDRDRPKTPRATQAGARQRRQSL